MTRSHLRTGAVVLALGAASGGAWTGLPAESDAVEAAISAPVAAAPEPAMAASPRRGSPTSWRK